MAISARRAETRQRLIDAARQTIAERGFRGASLDDIAARAGLTKGAVYDNFQSKDDLFLAVAAAWGSDRVARFAWPRGRSGTLKSRLRRLAKAFLADDPIARLDAPLRAEFLLYTITHAEMQALVAEMAARRLEHVRDHLLDFIDPAELRMSMEQFVILLEALAPGLVFLRIQAPHLITDQAVISLFEGLA
jgi:AcrR family transcriptional regulator